jgi:nucleoside 2-deoxyribosyltransferase
MNNRLNNQRVYLAGAMDRVADRGIGWRDSITPFLQSLGIVVFNPISKPTDIGLEDHDTHQIKTKLKQMSRYDELSAMMKTIRAVDLRLVDISDFMIVNLNLEHYACGTWEELYLCNRSKKPILIHIEQGKQYVPDWLFGTLPHEWFFSTWDELKKYLLLVNSENNIDLKNRWRFFDL